MECFVYTQCVFVSLSLSPSLSPHLLSFSTSHLLSFILSLSSSLPQSSESHGTVLLSMCYSPDSKKLSVILLRAKDLNKENDKETGQSIQAALHTQW